MTCQEFLARHAEYMDDLLTPPEVARCEAHAAACTSCARYDRVVRQGVSLLRSAPEVQPTDDFFPRLQHRLYNLEDELRDSSRGPGANAIVSLAIAGVLALLAWSPLMRLDQVLLPAGGMSEDRATAEAGSIAGENRGTALRATAAEPQQSGPAPLRFPQGGEQSSLRPLYPNSQVGAGTHLITGDRARGWLTAELLTEYSPAYELEPAEPWSTASDEVVWWWSGGYSTGQGLLPSPAGRMLDPRPTGYYSPLLTGVQAVRATGAQVVRSTRDTLAFPN
jgi:hypothetical protein